MENIFVDITVIICLSAILSIIFRALKQPAILAYILTGIILGPLGLFHIQNSTALQTLGQVGITLLLFMLGLELKLHELKSIGKTAIIAGTLQMWFTFYLSFFLARVLGYANGSALYVAIALSFSSTIVIVKLLSDKKDLNSLYGKIAIGILLMQDFFAVLTIIFLSGAKTGGASMFSPVGIGTVLIKVILLFAGIIYLSTHVFPRIMKYISKSSESLFLFSLAWVFAFTALVTSRWIGFSIEIGGFLAGIALANTNENFQIIARMQALRDFFITIFFVMLGLQMTFDSVSKTIMPAIIISIFVLTIKPLIVMGITGILGYRKRTSFFVGINLAQISEFSLLILFLGKSLGYVSSELVSTITLVGIITFAASTYLIRNTHEIYRIIHHLLVPFELADPHAEKVHLPKDLSDYEDHIIVIGAHQMGQSIVHALHNTKEKVLVVDFDPDRVKKIMNTDTPVLFGDITDIEIQERTQLMKAKMVISTVPDIEDNLLLIRSLNKHNRRAKIIVIAMETEDAKQLYKAGADYVVLPHLAGGRHLAKILIEKNHLKLIEDYKDKDMEFLT